MIKVFINGESFEVPENTTVAAAILNSGEQAFRLSVRGERRSPLCGMGVCFECRVTIDGRKHERSCTTVARSGMQITTDDAD